MLLLLLLGPLGQDAIDPARHPWLAWKPGSAARYRVALELGAVRQEGGVAYTLSEVGPSEFVLKVVATQLDKEVSSEQRESVPVRDGTETLALDGRTVPCTVWKSRGTRGGLAAETRLWIPDAGGAPLRWTSKIDGREDLTLSAAGQEVVKAAGRELRCVRLEGRDVLKNQAVTAWLSSEVPGGLVKLLTKGKVNGQELLSTLELVDVAEKK